MKLTIANTFFALAHLIVLVHGERGAVANYLDANNTGIVFSDLRPNGTRLQSGWNDKVFKTGEPDEFHEGWHDVEPADDATWNRYVCKGRKMLAQMSYSDFDVGQMLPGPANTAESPWRLRDLSEWGYLLTEIKDDNEFTEIGPGGWWSVGPRLRELGYSDKCVKEGGSWHATEILHDWEGVPQNPDGDEHYKAPLGDERRYTSAYFNQLVSPEGVITQNRKGPRESAKERFRPDGMPDDELPEFQKASDMMWAIFEAHVPEAQRHEMKVFAALAIVNKETNSLIKRAFEATNQEYSGQPVTFSMESDEGKAILASPNGSGFAHFLTQRKNLVGLKTIESVEIYNPPSGYAFPNMIFKIRNLDAPVPRPDETMKVRNIMAHNITTQMFEKRRNILRMHTMQVDRNFTVLESVYRACMKYQQLD